jgi:hypothetical protein
MTDPGRKQSGTSTRPSADRSIPRGTDEHAPDDADKVVQPSDDNAGKRADDRKSDA